MKSWIAGGMLLLFGAIVPVYSQMVTSDVFRAKIFVQGVIEYVSPVTSNQTVHTVQLSGADLVNLALGRQLGTKVPTNGVFAYGSNLSTNNMKVFVYDPGLASNLATIGEIVPQVEATGLAKNRSTSEVIAEMTVPGAGNATNGLAGGDFFLDGRSILETNGTIAKFDAKLIGYLDTILQATNVDRTCTNVIVSSTVTNEVCITNSVTVVGTNYTVLVRSATITTQGKKIGTLIEGEEPR